MMDVSYRVRQKIYEPHAVYIKKSEKKFNLSQICVY